MGNCPSIHKQFIMQAVVSPDDTVALHCMCGAKYKLILGRMFNSMLFKMFFMFRCVRDLVFKKKSCSWVYAVVRVFMQWFLGLCSGS